MTAPGQNLRVILVGGGIGGLTAAIALARRGVGAIVLEQAGAFGEAGAGVQLAPNATRALIGLGLDEPLRAVGFAPEAVEVRDSADGALLLSTRLGAAAQARWGAPYLQVHRADLQALLLREARRLGVHIRTGARVEAVEQDAGGVQVRLTGGAVVGGEVAIGCDGVHSGVRDALFGPSPARFTGQVAWRGLVRADRLPLGLVRPAATAWTGEGRHLVSYYVRGGELVNVVGVVDGQPWSRESWSEPGDPAALKADFAGWPAPVAALVAELGAPWRWAIHDRPPLARWNLGRIALLGDAAHPTAPFLAQGAGMAIEDACALGRRLAGHDPVAALAAYSAERAPRTARVRTWAQRNGVLFHLPRPARRAAFLGARLTARGGGMSRLDWLYGP